MADPDPKLIGAWVTARSMARGVALPVTDRGAFRVDTGSADEVRRYVFPHLCAGVGEVAASERLPGVLIKLCASSDVLAEALPEEWTAGHTGFVMRRDGAMPGPRPLPPAGYTIDPFDEGPVWGVRILDTLGQVAARGWSASHDGVIIYDRIVTEAGHRRHGLGRTVMRTLEAAAWNGTDTQLLVATDDGRALYQTLGWRVLSLYSTARRRWSPR